MKYNHGYSTVIFDMKISWRIHRDFTTVLTLEYEGTAVRLHDDWPRRQYAKIQVLIDRLEAYLVGNYTRSWLCPHTSSHVWTTPDMVFIADCQQAIRIDDYGIIHRLLPELKQYAEFLRDLPIVPGVVIGPAAAALRAGRYYRGPWQLAVTPEEKAGYPGEGNKELIVTEIPKFKHLYQLKVAVC